MDILERESQISKLEDALFEAKVGNGCLVLVSGEAGIGKTSLIKTFIRPHRETGHILWGSCDALFTPRPFGPLHDMVPQMAGEFPDLRASEIPRSSIFDAVLNELQGRPAIVVFEDVHWADEATLDLLRFIGRRINQTSAVLVITYRDDELSPRHPLRRVLGDLAPTSGSHRISLPPLSIHGVRSLVGEKDIDANLLHQQTGGNPYYVTEVLENAGEDIPATIKDAVMSRTARLSASGFAVLEAAAVIGQRIEPWLLAEVTGAEAQAVEEAMAAGLLLASEQELAFRHELARRIILEIISPPRKQVLHRMALDSLRSSAYTRDNLARLAHHAEAAGDREAILEYAPKAAHQASLAGAHWSAATLYELCLAHTADLPPHEQAELWNEYALELDVTDQRPAAIEAYGQAAELFETAGDTVKYASSLGSLSLLHHLVGESEKAEQVNDRAIRILEEIPPTKELLLAYNSQAVLYLAHMENHKGIKLAEKALALVEQLNEESLLPRLSETLGLCWLHVDHVKGIELLERSLEYGIELDQTMRVANSYANLSSVYVEFQMFGPAEDRLAKGLAYAAERDLEFARKYMLAWQAQLLLLQGQWNEAGRIAEEIVSIPGTSIGTLGPALTVVGRLRARRGDPGAAEALDKSLELLFTLGFRQREGLVRAARAEAAWMAGEPDRILEEAGEVYERSLEQRHPWGAGELAYWLWKAGEPVETPEWMARPYALQISGEWAAAAVEWQKMGCPYEKARALAEGDHQAQISALETFELFGARPDADQVRSSLQSAGVPNIPRRPHPSTRENPFGLTNRQFEIASLLVNGDTNTEIAKSLHISPKTVEHHVSAILAAFNVHSRDEAAKIVREHPDFQKK